MNLFDFFQSKEKKTSASVARERLQVIITHERSDRDTPDYLPAMKQDVLNVIRKYVAVENENVSIQFDTHEEFSILELNVTLPEASTVTK